MGITSIWDTTKAAGIVDGSGPWDSTSLNWNFDGGGIKNSTYPQNSSPRFGAGGLDGYSISTTINNWVSGMRFSATGTIASGGGILCKKSNGCTLTVDAGKTATIAVSIRNGDGNWTKSGTGTLTISRAGPYPVVAGGIKGTGTALSSGGNATGMGCGGGSPSKNGGYGGSGYRGGGGGGAAGYSSGGNQSSGSGGDGLAVFSFYNGSQFIYSSWYTTSGSFIIPSWTPSINSVKAWAVGAGASGGGCDQNNSCANVGGGSGATAWVTVSANAGDTIAYTIGTGGTASSGWAVGKAGGSTTITYNATNIAQAAGAPATVSYTASNGGSCSSYVGNGCIQGGGAYGMASGDYQSSAGGAIGNVSTTGDGNDNDGGTGASTNCNNLSGLCEAYQSAGGNYYLQNTILSAGTTNITNGSALGVGTVTVNAGATLNKNGMNMINTVINNGGTINP